MKEETAGDLQEVGLWALVGYFLRLGAFGFGGPIALAGYMHRDLVPRRWISDQEYLEGLAFAQMMPGPLAAQLAMWIGYIRHGFLGASLVGLVFVLPAFVMVVGVSKLYVTYEGLPVVQELFYGIGPVVISIVALSALRLGRTTVGNDRRLWCIFGVVAVVTLMLRAEIALLFIAGGLIGVLLYDPAPRWGRNLPAILPFPALAFVPLALPVLLQLGAFFVKAGAFTFGSGLAIVPFLHEGVVLQHHWLNERQFLDAVAVGIITPGPVIITAAFVGYLVASLPGAAVAAAGVFLPVYCFVLFVGRYLIRYRQRLALQGFVKGATSAASGAIAGAAVILAQGAVTDLTTAAIGVVALFLLWRYKLPEPVLIAGGALAGILLH